MKRLKIMTIFGTRPEAIKMAPLILEMNKNHELIDSIVCVTAQHRQMMDQVLNAFNIEPNYDLNVMTHKQTLEDLSIRILQGLDPIYEKEMPDIVLVHGDTLTTYLASYLAFLKKIQVGHVEAGLRTWNKFAPFPEEMNRQLTSKLANLHFAPTNWSAKNLIMENISNESIYITGNTITDVMKYTVEKDYYHEIFDWAEGKRIILITAHRRESQGEPHKRVFRAIRRIADEFEDIAIVFPVHLSPIVKETTEQYLLGHPRIRLIEPLDVIDLYNFYPKTFLILTDSGGIQEEAPSFGIPVLVLRDTTERPEGVEAGCLEIVGTDETTVYERTRALLTDKELYSSMSRVSNPYGDGNASQRIVQSILFHFGRIDERPNNFN